MNTFRSPSLRSRTVPAFLLLLSILAYGLLIPWLGYYWDDWAKLLVSRLYGLGGYIAYYAGDRPLSAWTHILFTPLVGQSPLGWHIFVLVLRWLGAWGMWWTLEELWPSARRQNLIAAALFLVYPVFMSQPVALTFHQQLLQYALFFLSLGAMLRAWRVGGQPKARWRWSALALAAMLVQFSVTEYFVPLELVRPLMLWFIFSAAQDQPVKLPARVASVLRAWAPYLVLLAAYIVYRLFFIRLSGEDPYRAKTLFDFFTDPLGTLQTLALTVWVDIWRILFSSWADLVQIKVLGAAPAQKLAYLVGLAAGVGSGLFIIVLDWQAGAQTPGAPKSISRWMRQSALLGSAVVLLGPLPAWISGRQVVFDFHSDRYAMPAMFGAALLFAGLICWLSQRRVQQAVLAGFLIFLATTLHLRVANDYRWLWTEQMRVYWQLYWRAPGLEPGTALFFETEPIPNQGLFSTSSAINLLYPQARKTDPKQLDLDYYVYTIRPRYSHAPDSTIIALSTRFRTLQFKGTTPQSLLVYKNPKLSSCLWVVSEQDSDNPYLPEVVKGFLPISNLGQIHADSGGAVPPPELFGAEPEHDWCYYFQKASLARQEKDWVASGSLANQVLELGYLPTTSGSDSPTEWLPFIVGLAHTQRWNEAARLVMLAYQRDRDAGQMLCRLWNGELADAPGAEAAHPFTHQVNTSLSCKN